MPSCKVSVLGAAGYWWGVKGGAAPQGSQTHLHRDEQPMMAKTLKRGLTRRAANTHPKLRAGVGGQTKPKPLHLINGKQFKLCFSAVRGALIPGMT